MNEFISKFASLYQVCVPTPHRPEVPLELCPYSIVLQVYLVPLGIFLVQFYSRHSRPLIRLFHLKLLLIVISILFFEHPLIYNFTAKFLLNPSNNVDHPNLFRSDSWTRLC